MSEPFVWRNPSPERDALAAYLRDNPRVSLEQAARQFGVSFTHAQRVATAYGVRPRRQRRKPGVIATGMLGDLLRELDSRMTVEETALRTGIDAAVISNLRGRRTGSHVSFFTMQCLANAAGYDLKLVPRG